MRILIFHGYLLSGTGSNVYNARLAEALVRLGHEVHLLCQDRHPERYPFASAAGDWDSGELRMTSFSARPCGDAGSCTIYRPDIRGLLPLYVQDRYEGVQAKTFSACTDVEIDAYLEANVDAVHEVQTAVQAEIALANHLVMGPVILARALFEHQVPYAVKVHGSALEYTVKPEPERFLRFAREGLAGARTVLVGSRHTAESLWAALEEPGLEQRTRLGPPGVDVERFTPRSRPRAQACVQALTETLRASAVAATEETGKDESVFARDDAAAAQALERLAAHDGPLVAFVGKLIVSKGVDLLIAAWPLVLRSHPQAQLAIVGFGAYRDGLESLVRVLGEGDLPGARQIALAGRSLERQADLQTVLAASGRPGRPTDAPLRDVAPLRHLLAFLDSLSPEQADLYRACARGLEERVVFVGRLDHAELAELLPMCEALVVPSTFPEAFGMVAVEAAACGVLPISAAHSGLAEVSEAIAYEVPATAAKWLTFPIDDEAAHAIAVRASAWLSAEGQLAQDTRAALVSIARKRWSWEGVARGVIAAALGE